MESQTGSFHHFPLNHDSLDGGEPQNSLKFWVSHLYDSIYIIDETNLFKFHPSILVVLSAKSSGSFPKCVFSRLPFAITGLFKVV